MGNEKILYQSKPSILFGCKKVIYGIIALIILSFISSKITKYVRDMQVYYVSFVKYPISTCLAIVFLVLSFIIIIYIIYQLLTWYSTEYVLTDSRVILKKGLIYTRKNYMSYNVIQDINSSQSFIAKIFGVSSIEIYSAYDNNQIRFNNISEAQKVEEFIFNMMNNRNHFNYNPQMSYGQNPYNNSYGYNNNFYDEDIRLQHEYYPNNRYRNFEDPEGVITPNQNYNQSFYNHEDVVNSKYNSYRNFEDPEGVITPNHNYYNDDLDQTVNDALNNLSNKDNNKNYRKSYSKEVEDYFIEINHEKKDVNNEFDEVVSDENLIKKHFDKFKK